MKTLKSVYKKLNKNYRNIDIDFDEEKDMLVIYKNNLKIETDSDRVEVFKNNKYLFEYHPKNYDDLYECISLYLNDIDSVQKKVKLDSLKQYLLITLLTIIFVFITNVFLGVETYIFVIVNVFIILCLSIILYFMCGFILKKLRLSHVSKEELDVVKKYDFIHKDWGLLSENKLFFSFECIDIVCDDFLNMRKKLHFKKCDLFDVDFEKQVNDTKNKDILNWYIAAKEAIDVVYKYYDKNGRRKI